MSIKKSYNVGDTVWIYGIGRLTNKPCQGKVIKIIDLTDCGYSIGPHYIIQISTYIEPLLEIRTWDTISQDELGPVGGFRELGNIEPTIQLVSKVGFQFDDNPNQVHMDTVLNQNSIRSTTGKEQKPRRRYSRKNKSNE